MKSGTIDPFFLTLRVVVSVIGLLFVSAIFLPLILSWRANGLFGRVFTISMGAATIGHILSIYVRIVTLNTDLLQNPEHWQIQLLPNFANTIVIGFFLPTATTLHLASIDAKIQHKRWTRVLLFLSYGIVSLRLVMGAIWPDTILESLSLTSSRDFTFVRQPYAIIFPGTVFLTILVTMVILLRWPSRRVWELVINRIMLMMSFILVSTPISEIYAGIPLHIIQTLCAAHVAYFYYRFPETNITRRISQGRQQALQRTDFLYRIGRLLNENLDSIEVFQTLTQETRNIFKANHVNLELLAIDPAAVSQFTSGAAQPARTAQDLKANVIETKTLLHDDTTIVGPIVMQDELLGVIEVHGVDSIGTYEQDLLNGITQQASIAIKNIQLLAAEQKARVQAEVLFDVAQAATEELKTETEARQDLEIAAAIQAERDRIGRETHDGLLQRFNGQRLRIDYWRSLLDPDQTELLTELDTMESELGRGTSELRRLIQGLHTGTVQTAFGKKLTETNALATKTYGVTIHNNINFDADQLGKDEQHELAHIIQDIINNAGKHAQATDVWLTNTVSDDQSRVQIQIKDNGIGVDVSQDPPNPSFNLNKLKVRTALLGGTLSIESAVGEGTSIQLSIPFDSEAEVM